MRSLKTRPIVLFDPNYKAALVQIPVDEFSELRWPLARTVTEKANAIYSIDNKKWIKSRERDTHPLVVALESVLLETWAHLPVAELTQIGEAPWEVAYVNENSGFHCGYISPHSSSSGSFVQQTPSRE